MRVCDGICALVIIIILSENIVCCVYDEAPTKLLAGLPWN